MQYRRADDMTWDVSEDRAVVLDAGGTTLITLNPVGTLLWQMLEAPRAAQDLVDELSREFPDVPRSQIRDDVTAFLDDLVRERLLVEHITSN